MVLQKIFLVTSLIALAYSLPLNESQKDDDSEGRAVHSNNLFKEINKLLERDIGALIGRDSVEIGDTLSTNKGDLSVSIQKFSFDNYTFPVTFKPNNDSLVDDNKEITALEGDFDDAVIYKIEIDYPSEETTTIEPEDEATQAVKKAQKKISDEKTTLLKAVEAEPILTTV